MALNGGPDFHFSHAISLMVNCKIQKEIDEMWEKLSAGGKTEQCGLPIDKYGVSWQIVPSIMSKRLLTKNPKKTGRVMKEIIKLEKLEFKVLKGALQKKD